MKKYRKIFLFLGAGLGIVIILAALSLMLVKRLVTPERVKEELLAYLSEKIGGEVEFNAVEINFFPGPHVVLKGGKFSVPDKLEGNFETMIVYPKALPMLRGEVDVSRLKIIKPEIKVLINETSAEESHEPEDSFSFGVFKDYLAGALGYLDSHGRGLNAEIENGTLILQKDSAPGLSFSNMNADLILPDDRLRIEVRSESNLWAGFDFRAWIDVKNYKGSGSLVIKGGKPHRFMDFYLPDKKLVSDSVLNLAVKFNTQDLKIFQSKIEASVPKLTLTGGGEELNVSARDINADLYIDGEMQAFTLKSARLINPGLELSGKYTADNNPPGVSLSLLGNNVDVVSARDSALFVAGENDIVDNIFEVVRAGTVPKVTLDAKAATFRDLWRPGNFKIEGNMVNGEIYIPKAEFDIVAANGNAVIADGVLKGSNLSGKLGNSTGHEGTLLIGLKGPDGPLNLDIMVDADPSQIPPVLGQFIQTESFRKEMDLIRNVKGFANGRLVLEGQKKSAEAKVSVSEFDVTADYGRFPYPVSVKGGTFDYEDKKIGVEGLNVAAGKLKSSISSATYEWKDNSYFNVSSSDTAVDLGEFYPWLSSLDSLKTRLKDIGSAKGTALFKRLEFSGSVSNPADWKISGEGSLSAVNLNLTGFNDLINVTSADIKSTPGRLSVSNAGVSVQNSNINLNMVLNNYLTDLLEMRVDFTGTLEPREMGLFSEYVNLPKELVFESPLSVTDSSLVLRKGDVTPAGAVQAPLNSAADAGRKLNLNVNIRTDKLEWKDSETQTPPKPEPPGKDAWNSPVNGTVNVKSENFKFKKLNWDSLDAVVTFLDHGVNIDVTQADLCGISTPGLVQIHPPGVSFEFKPATSEEELASVLKCLLNKAGIISGDLDLDAKVSSDGSARDVYTNLEGGMELTSRNGRVEKYGGLAKFFTILNFGELFRGQGPEFDKEGFPYDKLTAKADIKDGKVTITEAAMDGPSIKVVCEGFIDLVNKKLDLQLLVIPVMAVDSVIKKIPIVNFVLGKNFVSIPIRVTGDLSNPDVEKLSPSAISFGLFGLIKQTLNIPVTIFKPISKKEKKEEKKEEVKKETNEADVGNNTE